MVGLTEHLTDILSDHGGSSLKLRLEKLEASSSRIENMLTKLCDSGGGDVTAADADGDADDESPLLT